MNNQMNANEKKLKDVFSREYKRYNVPNYQRPYSWSKMQAEELFEDLNDAFYQKNNETEYFMGSIITILNDDENTYDIIDGQQRLITLSLFFLAIKKYFEVKKNIDKNISNVIHEIEGRLTNNNIGCQSNDTKIKVRTIDQSFYDNLILGKNNSDEDSDSKRRMLSNYELFKDKLLDLNFEDEKMINFYVFLISKVSLVLISTTNIASSFRIFDVLNSRGLPLTTIDLLKSKIFEKVFLKYPEKNSELEHQWLTLEESIGIDNLNGFYVTHCLSKLEKNDLLFSKAVDKYEDRLNTDPSIINNPLIIINDLKKSAKNYLKFYEKDFNDSDIKQSCIILSYINRSSRINSKNSTYSTWIPPLLALKNRIDDFRDEGDITNENFKEFIKIYEVFFLQMMLLRFNKAQIQSSYGNLIACINRLENYQTIKDTLLKMLKNQEVEAILHKDFKVKTSTVNQVVKGLFLRLNFDYSDEKYSLTDLSNLTLEHILPQKININYWKDRFNDLEHLEWINRLGNFVLLHKVKNSSAKNNDFKSKKIIYQKDTNSIFPLTREIANYNDWSKSEIHKRHTDIVRITKKLLLQYK